MNYFIMQQASIACHPYRENLSTFPPFHSASPWMMWYKQSVTMNIIVDFNFSVFFINFISPQACNYLSSSTLCSLSLSLSLPFSLSLSLFWNAFYRITSHIVYPSVPTFHSTIPEHRWYMPSSRFRRQMACRWLLIVSFHPVPRSFSASHLHLSLHIIFFLRSGHYRLSSSISSDIHDDLFWPQKGSSSQATVAELLRRLKWQLC